MRTKLLIVSTLIVVHSSAPYLMAELSPFGQSSMMNANDNPPNFDPTAPVEFEDAPLGPGNLDDVYPAPPASPPPTLSDLQAKANEEYEWADACDEASSLIDDRIEYLEDLVENEDQTYFNGVPIDTLIETLEQRQDQIDAMGEQARDNADAIEDIMQQRIEASSVPA